MHDHGRVRPTTTTSRNMAVILQSRITADIFDIRHPYDVQLTAVILRDLLICIKLSYRGLRFRAHRCCVSVFLEVDRCHMLVFD